MSQYPRQHLEPLEIPSSPVCMLLLAIACQAADEPFFDRAVQLEDGEPAAGAETLRGTGAGSSGSTGTAVERDTAGGGLSASPSSTSSSVEHDEPSSPSSGADGGPPSSNGPDASPSANDAPAQGLPPCSTEACVACREGQLCGPGLVCHPQQGSCVPPCDSDGACAAAPGLPVCTGNDDTVLGVCAECRVDADCASDDLPACDGRGVCVECTTNQHCADQGGDRNACNAEQGRCVECVTDADCGSENPVCVDAECEETD